MKKNVSQLFSILMIFVFLLQPLGFEAYKNAFKSISSAAGVSFDINDYFDPPQGETD